jgi:peptide/nickel transport system permease protein
MSRIFSKILSNKRLGAGIVIGAAFLITAIFADFIAPYDHKNQTRNEPSAPRSAIHFVDNAGSFHARPFIYRVEMENALQLKYREVRDERFPIGCFVSGDKYLFLGLIESDLHLFGVIGANENKPRLHLLGTDALGRDRFSRLVRAIQFSMIVSPLGALLAWLIGILIGVVSGYSSRRIDTILMGVADAMLSLPTLIIILAARAAFPLELPPFSAGLLLVSIFALVGWAEIARLARSLVVSTRENEYVLAAKAGGVTNVWILLRHILPNIARPLITQATLILPAFLLAEATLSFLGVGLQEPEPSLGNLLAAAVDITMLKIRPLELLAPAIAIFVFVLGIRLLADGLKERKI